MLPAAGNTVTVDQNLRETEVIHLTTNSQSALKQPRNGDTVSFKPQTTWIQSMTVIGWCLTWVRHPEPGRQCHDVPSGISATFVSIAIRVSWQQVGQSEDITDEPHQHDGKDDLKEGGAKIQITSSLTSSSICVYLYLQETS